MSFITFYYAVVARFFFSHANSQPVQRFGKNQHIELPRGGKAAV